ncbi:unspecific monooxygenase [Blastomyces silverae]|uniref:Unspecific monooxygenase n=1 Tax=Blastomyces silverae TaxID=2060906 RepID=A0A0H1BPP5_9EURO|nr:unspecific monooxygenase [Blastomyces silverae]
MRGNRTIHKAHQKYGPIVRLGPSEISVNCVDGGIRTVYAGGFEKHDWYPRVFGAYGTLSMFSMVGTKPHSVRKRMMSNIYSKSYLQSSPHMATISQAVICRRLLPILQRNAQFQSNVEVHELNNAITMDFVSAYIFGLASGTNFLEDVPAGREWFRVYQSRKPFEFFHQEVPSVTSLARTLKIPLIPKWCDKANQDMEDWGLEMIDNAEKFLASTNPACEPIVYKQVKQSMLKQLAKDGLEANTGVLSQQRLELACEMYDHLTAGHETSAVALTYLYWELSRHPDLQVELRKELGTLSPRIMAQSAPEIPTELPHPKDIDALPFLDAIIMEALRLHSPIPGIQPRITPAPSTTLAGYDQIPPKTRVNAQAYSLHRNHDVFPNPESFLPHRWLKPKDSVDLENMRRWFWAFGSGGRMCVGSNLALQEMKLVVAAIYSNFTSKIVDDEGIEPIDAYSVRPSSNKLVLKFERV